MNIQIAILDFEMKKGGRRGGRKDSPFCLFVFRFYPMETVTQFLSYTVTLERARQRLLVGEFMYSEYYFPKLFYPKDRFIEDNVKRVRCYSL